MSDPKEQAGSPGRIAASKEEAQAGTKATAESVVLVAEVSGAVANGSASREADLTSTVEGATASRQSSYTPETTSLTVLDESALSVWNEQIRRRMRHQSRRSFLTMGIGALAAFSAFGWLTSRREIDGLPWPFRNILDMNEQLWRDFFSPRHLSPEVSQSHISAERVNGDIGLDSDIDVSTWRLEVHGLALQSAPLRLGLDAIKRLPRFEMTTEFKCIEGWSVVVHWAGARFAEFMKAYPPRTLSGDPMSLDDPEDLPPYVSMATADGEYYVGLDMESMLHPQTLLCYEMNGSPLTEDHGAPLRLVIPVKYGVKNIKQIGTIRYTTRRPPDYWAERGYDWYVGL